MPIRVAPYGSLLCCVLCLQSLLPSLHGDTIGPGYESPVRSPSGRYELEVVPADADGFGPGRCKATLFRFWRGTRIEVWSRDLINNWSPVYVFVTDSGRYVVTMDECDHVGTLPIVIYGRHGKLVHVHNLQSLRLQEDLSEDRILSTDFPNCHWWNEDAIIFFGPKEEHIFVRLHWGELLIVELASGDVIRKQVMYSDFGDLPVPERQWQAFQAFADRRSREIAWPLLSSEFPEDRKTGAMVAGQLRMRKAIARLRELLQDDASDLTNVDQPAGLPMRAVFYVRKAAKQALEAMGETVTGVVIEQPEAE